MSDDKKRGEGERLVHEAEKVIGKTITKKVKPVLDTIPPPESPPDKGGDKNGGQDSE